MYSVELNFKLLQVIDLTQAVTAICLVGPNDRYVMMAIDSAGLQTWDVV